MKICKKCNIEKPIGDFHARPGKYPGLTQSRCKECQKGLRKTWGTTASGRASSRKQSRTPKSTARRELYVRTLATDPRGRAGILVNSARQRSRARGIEFRLDAGAIAAVIALGVCEATGLAFDLTPPESHRDNNRFAPSLDRLDRNKGYTHDNVRVVCWHFNLARSSYGDDAMLELAEAIVRTISREALEKSSEPSTTISSESSGKCHEAHGALLN